MKINRGLATELGLDPDALASPDGVEHPRRQPHRPGLRADRAGLRRASVWRLRAATRRWPRHPHGRSHRSGGTATRPAVESFWARRPYSRRGDGRAAIGPVLREYLVSEAMHALGLPTTRALAAVTTGEQVVPRVGYCRVGSSCRGWPASHVRVGTFEYFAARGHTEAVRRLADYVIARHYPGRPPPPIPIAPSSNGSPRARQPGRAAAADGIHSRRDEHRQHHGRGRDHRLRALRLHGPLRSGHGVQFHRPSRPPSLCKSAANRGWNLARLAEAIVPLLADDSEQAVADGQRGDRHVPGPVLPGRSSLACGEKLGRSPKRRPMPHWLRPCSTPWRPTTPTLP